MEDEEDDYHIIQREVENKIQRQNDVFKIPSVPHSRLLETIALDNTSLFMNKWHTLPKSMLTEKFLTAVFRCIAINSSFAIMEYLRAIEIIGDNSINFIFLKAIPFGNLQFLIKMWTKYSFILSQQNGIHFLANAICAGHLKLTKWFYNQYLHQFPAIGMARDDLCNAFQRACANGYIKTMQWCIYHFHLILIPDIQSIFYRLIYVESYETKLIVFLVLLSHFEQKIDDETLLLCTGEAIRSRRLDLLMILLNTQEKRKSFSLKNNEIIVKIASFVFYSKCDIIVNQEYILQTKEIISFLISKFPFTHSMFVDVFIQSLSKSNVLDASLEIAFFIFTKASLRATIENDDNTMPFGYIVDHVMRLGNKYVIKKDRHEINKKILFKLQRVLKLRTEQATAVCHIETTLTFLEIPASLQNLILNYVCYFTEKIDFNNKLEKQNHVFLIVVSKGKEKKIHIFFSKKKMTETIVFVIKHGQEQKTVEVLITTTYEDFECLLKKQFDLQSCKIIGLKLKNPKTPIESTQQLTTQFILKPFPNFNKIQLINHAKQLCKAEEKKTFEFYKDEMQDEVCHEDILLNIKIEIAFHRDSLFQTQKSLIGSKDNCAKIVNQATIYALENDVEAFGCIWSPCFSNYVASFLFSIALGSSLQIVHFLWTKSKLTSNNIAMLFKRAIPFGDLQFLSALWDLYNTYLETKVDLYECILIAMEAGQLRVLKWLWKLLYNFLASKTKCGGMLPCYEGGILTHFWLTVGADEAVKKTCGKGFENSVKWVIEHTTFAGVDTLSSMLKVSISCCEYKLFKYIFQYHNSHITMDQLKELTLTTILRGSLRILKYLLREDKKRYGEHMQLLTPQQVFDAVDYRSANQELICLLISLYHPTNVIVFGALTQSLLVGSDCQMAFLFFCSYMTTLFDFLRTTSVQPTWILVLQQKKIMGVVPDGNVFFTPILNCLIDDTLSTYRSQLGVQNFLQLLERCIDQEQMVQYIAQSFINMPEVLHRLVINYYCGSDGRNGLLFQKEYNQIKAALNPLLTLCK